MMFRYGGWLCLTAVFGCGCSAQPLYPLQSPSSDATLIGDQFDLANTGTLRGKVSWEGERPALHSDVFFSLYPGEAGIGSPHRNPLVPQIHAKGGLADAVVFLRGIDPRRANPTTHPPVRVVFEKNRIQIEQGELPSSRFGLVRPGDSVEFLSREPGVQILHLDGAAFFTMTFTEQERPRTRVLHHKGWIEVSHVSGSFGAKAWLIVDDHPYYTRTDATGAYSFEHVPAGEYEVVCRVPDWHVLNSERDPETCLIARVRYQPPVERKQTIEVRPAGTRLANFAVGLKHFTPSPR